MSTHYKRLSCPNCKKPESAHSKGKFYVELKTVESKTYLVATCPTCKRSQILPVKIKPTECGAIRHCGTNYYHKVLITTKNYKVKCSKCKFVFSYEIRTP